MNFNKEKKMMKMNSGVYYKKNAIMQKKKQKNRFVMYVENPGGMDVLIKDAPSMIKYMNGRNFDEIIHKYIKSILTPLCQLYLRMILSKDYSLLKIFKRES